MFLCEMNDRECTCMLKTSYQRMHGILTLFYILDVTSISYVYKPFFQRPRPLFLFRRKRRRMGLLRLGWGMGVGKGYLLLDGCEGRGGM